MDPFFAADRLRWGAEVLRAQRNPWGAELAAVFDGYLCDPRRAMLEVALGLANAQGGSSWRGNFARAKAAEGLREIAASSGGTGSAKALSANDVRNVLRDYKATRWTRDRKSGAPPANDRDAGCFRTLRALLVVAHFDDPAIPSKRTVQRALQGGLPRANLALVLARSPDENHRK
jgi:hypothetical protein